jgi:acetoin utilization deacetylase AcuC-like enzyme
MKVYFSNYYTLPLPEGHRFPMQKYKMLYDFLLSENILSIEDLHESFLATEDLLQLAHDPHYIEAMKTGRVDLNIMRRIGFPWSEQLYTRSCATVGGAMSAALSAIEDGISGNLAGGTHHAHYDRGEGYCVFNDIAVASRYLKSKNKNLRIVIIDLDVHQGNGNSSILFEDEDTFIFSMHGEKNYPFKKVPSHLDIALPDGIDDEIYIEKLKWGLDQVQLFRPDFIFYQMGVDPLKEDKLGRMNLTFEGLMRRDELVLRFAKENNVPISLALGGGYAEPIELSVRAYANTYRVAKKIFT